MPPLFFCLILIILNVLDALTTVYGLSIGRTELNHIFPPVEETLPIKLALPFLYLGFFYITSKFCLRGGFKWGSIILKFNVILLVLFYFAIIVNNLIVILWA